MNKKRKIPICFRYEKNKDGSSTVYIPPISTSYIEYISKTLGLDPVVFISKMFQGINTNFEPWRKKN